MIVAGDLPPGLKQNAAAFLLGTGISLIFIIASVVLNMMVEVNGIIWPLVLIGVLLSAWLGGVLGAAGGTGLAIVAIWTYFFPPQFTSHLTAWQIWYLVSFVISALALDAFIIYRRRYEQKLQATDSALSEALRGKDEFIGLMSHELRTPITVIYGSARLLLTRAMDQEQREETLKSIEVESHRLNGMIEDLLTLARLGLNKPDPQAIFVPDALAEIIDGHVRRSSHFAPITTQVRPEVRFVTAEHGYLARVLDNLLENAEKYGPSGSPIAVDVSSYGDEVQFAVTDSGPGVLPSELRVIFDRFYRSGRTSTYAPGTGLGLTVCKRLIESQGGRIWAELPDSGGLRVCFTLPVAPRATTSDVLEQRSLDDKVR